MKKEEIDRMKYNSQLLLILLFASLFALAGAKPDFSGKWQLDKDKSFSNPPGLEQTLNVTHTGDQLKMEAHVKTARGEQDVNETYTIDGKEYEFKPQQPPNAKGKRKTVWLPNGQSLMVSDEVSVDGKVVSQVMRKWTLSADGKTLTIDYYFDDQRGSFEAKRVFFKVS
jgi:hypothetical protein